MICKNFITVYLLLSVTQPSCLKQQFWLNQWCEDSLFVQTVVDEVCLRNSFVQFHSVLLVAPKLHTSPCTLLIFYIVNAVLNAQSFWEKQLLSIVNCIIEHSAWPKGADHANVTYQSSLFYRMRSCDNMTTGAATSHSNLEWCAPLCSAACSSGRRMFDWFARLVSGN